MLTSRARIFSNNYISRGFVIKHINY